MCCPFSDLSQMSAQWTEPSEFEESKSFLRPWFSLEVVPSVWPTPEPDSTLWTSPPYVRKADGIFDDDKDDFANRSESWLVRRRHPMAQRRPRSFGKEDWHLCSCGEMHCRGVRFFAEDDCRREIRCLVPRSYDVSMPVLIQMDRDVMCGHQASTAFSTRHSHIWAKRRRQSRFST